MTDSNKHAAEQIKVGMSRQAVIELLGPPDRSTTLQDVLSQYTVIGNVPDEGAREAWLYVNTPPGHHTNIAIYHGVVDEVVIDEDSGQRPAKKPASGGRLRRFFKKG